MSRLLYTVLLMLSLSQRQASVEAGSIPTPDEIELSILKITVTEQQETIQRITERLKSIITIESELYDTRDLLAQTLIQLASTVDPKEKEISTDDDDHIIRERSAEVVSGDGSGEDSDDYLNGYYLHNLVSRLSTTTCKDGRDGNDGNDGLPGTPGVDGNDGTPGTNGMNGQNGQDGTPGTPGTPGTDGSDGADGSPGDKGDSGTAVKGEKGDDGVQGPDGSVGLNGLGGPKGDKGDEGATGTKGIPGLTGDDGEKGEKGTKGLEGLKGETSDKGEPGEKGAAAQSGAVYTRWGKPSCPAGTYLIYDGFTAGGYYNAAGGGVNFQCLPNSPEYNSFSGSGGSIITGVEYADGASVFSTVFKHRDNVPCARCLTDRTALMMYPARRSCPSGWTMEYEGYLMSGHSGHGLPTTYECVDKSPEYLDSSYSNLAGGLLYFVSPKCKSDGGTISCTPYYKNRQLACVVCSK